MAGIKNPNYILHSPNVRQHSTMTACMINYFYFGFASYSYFKISIKCSKLDLIPIRV